MNWHLYSISKRFNDVEINCERKLEMMNSQFLHSVPKTNVRQRSMSFISRQLLIIIMVSSSSSSSSSWVRCSNRRSDSQSIYVIGRLHYVPTTTTPDSPSVRRGGRPAGVCVTSRAVIRGRQRRRPRRPGSWLGRIWHAHPYKSLISRWLNCGAAPTMRRCSQLIYAGACGETTNSSVQT